MGMGICLTLNASIINKFVSGLFFVFNSAMSAKVFQIVFLWALLCALCALCLNVFLDQDVVYEFIFLIPWQTNLYETFLWLACGRSHY